VKRSRIFIAAAAVAVAATLGAAVLPGAKETAADPGPVGITISDIAGPVPSTQDVDGVIRQLRHRIDADPSDWASWAKLGLAYLAKSRAAADPDYYSKAEHAFETSIRINDESNFEAFFGMASLQASRHRFAGALRWARRGAEMRPDNADVRGVMGDALVELGRYGLAADAMQKMINLRPALPSYARISYLSELHGNMSDARAAMRSALRAAGTQDDAAWALFHLGQLYFNAGALQPALERYERAARIAPSNLLGKAGIAKVAAARGRFAKASRLMEEVVAGSGEPGYPVLLSEYYLAAGHRQKAQRAFSIFREREAAERSNGTDTNLETALIEADRGTHLNDALRRARTEYAKRRSVHVADALCWVLYAHGRDEQAARYSRESLRLGTKNALFHFHAGMIAKRLDRHDSAQHHLERALDINPYFSLRHAPTARRVLDGLTGR
jgi:tetratricopeptide (TPR) repeat protein